MHDAASVVDAPRGTATAAHHCDSIAGAGPEPQRQRQSAERQRQGGRRSQIKANLPARHSAFLLLSDPLLPSAGLSIMARTSSCMRAMEAGTSATEDGASGGLRKAEGHYRRATVAPGTRLPGALRPQSGGRSRAAPAHPCARRRARAAAPRPRHPAAGGGRAARRRAAQERDQ